MNTNEKVFPAHPPSFLHWWSVLVASDSTFFVLAVSLCYVNQWWGTLM
jgi:hypothetical protein